MSEGIPRRSIRFNVGLQIVAMVILLVGLNYFSFNNYFRADFSRAQRFVLSDQTKRVLRELSKPVRITVVFSQTATSPETGQDNDVSNLLKELIFSGRKKIEVETVDPTRDPTRARELQAKYKFTAEENVLILEYEGRTKFVPVADMGEFDMTPTLAGGEPKLTSFNGEQALTNAMIALIDPERKKVYFLQGHGEPAVDGLTPIRTFKDYIERQNATVLPLSLGSLDNVPADCALLVILAPKFDLSDREAEIATRYWSGPQGRLLVLIDPNAKTPRLDAFLSGAGITPMDDRVLRIVRLPFATGILRDVTGEFLAKNAITKRLVDSQIEFPGATKSLTLATPAGNQPALQVRPLIQAKEEFWGETDYVTDEKKGVRYDEGRDVGQPVYIAAASARSGVSDDRVEADSAKMLVTGSAQFAFDASLTQEGIDFLLSSSNWLLDRNRLTGVMPKNIQHFLLNLSDAQLRSIVLYTMIVMPGIVAVLGLIAWFRRRA